MCWCCRSLVHGYQAGRPTRSQPSCVSGALQTIVALSSFGAEWLHRHLARISSGEAIVGPVWRRRSCSVLSERARPARRVLPARVWRSGCERKCGSRRVLRVRLARTGSAGAAGGGPDRPVRLVLRVPAQRAGAGLARRRAVQRTGASGPQGPQGPNGAAGPQGPTGSTTSPVDSHDRHGLQCASVEQGTSSLGLTTNQALARVAPGGSTFLVGGGRNHCLHDRCGERRRCDRVELPVPGGEPRRDGKHSVAVAVVGCPSGRHQDGCKGGTATVTAQAYCRA